MKSAETRSPERGLEDGIYLARIIKEIYSGEVSEDQIKVEARIDSKTLFDSLHSSKQVDEKTIRHFVAWIKQQLDQGFISKIDWVNSNLQLADV